jgi:hypothetical protein
VTSDAELRNTVGHPATDEVTDHTIIENPAVFYIVKFDLILLTLNPSS